VLEGSVSGNRVMKAQRRQGGGWVDESCWSAGSSPRGRKSVAELRVVEAYFGWGSGVGGVDEYEESVKGEGPSARKGGHGRTSERTQFWKGGPVRRTSVVGRHLRCCRPWPILASLSSGALGMLVTSQPRFYITCMYHYLLRSVPSSSPVLAPQLGTKVDPHD